MDVGEVKKLDAYLKRLFGNARIHVVPTKADAADVVVRFPRDWLRDWRMVAGNLDRLIASLRRAR